MPPVVETQAAVDRDVAATKRLKKREIDRRCQREARQRTKSRIAYLEGLVEELRRKDTSGQVASLMQQVADVRKERDMFARTLRGIEDSIKSHRTVFVDSPPKRGPDSPPPQNGHAERSNGKERAGRESLASVQSVSAVGDEEGTRTNGHATALSEADVGAIAAAAQPPMPHVAAGMPSHETRCECCDPPEDHLALVPSKPQRRSIWRFAHTVLDQPPVLSNKALRWEDEHSNDIPVRAVIDGWPAVAARLGGQLPPLWARLRRIDEVIFGKLDRVERLAILFVMHLLMRSHVEPSSTEMKEKIPSWYLPRPSQNLSHPYALDFFTWPGIRERLIFSQHSYCTNAFWMLHNTSLKVLWQYDFRDCYSVNVHKGEYQLSRAFEERVTDINAWTMRSEFFRRWPECYGDIPSLESVATPMTQLLPKPPATAAMPQRIRATKRRASQLDSPNDAEEDTSHEPPNNGAQEIDALHSQFLSDSLPHGDAWKNPFERRATDESVYMPLSQDSYLSALPNSHANIWDMRTPEASSAQDWLWLQDGPDPGMPET